MGKSTVQLQAMEERRRKVAGLHLQGVKVGPIAKAMKCNRNTITLDITWLETEWRKELIDDPVALKARELAKLETMERTAAGEKGPVWFSQRLKVMERRAKMLGLDAGIVVSGPDGKPIQHAVVIASLVDLANEEGGT